MNEAELKQKYKAEYDGIHASDELRKRVLAAKAPARSVSPLKATIGTIAATFMIFAAVHEYDFNKNADGVISETTVATETPYAEFKPVETEQTETVAESTAKAKSDTAENVKSTTKETAKPKKDKASEMAAPTKAPAKVQAASQNKEQPQNAAEGKNAEADDTETVQVHSEIQHEPEVQAITPRTVGGETPVSEVEVWNLNEYYSYIGSNIAAAIGGAYVGSGNIELEIGENGTPLDDTAVLPFSYNGGQISITVSKNPLFAEGQNGTLTNSGSGYNAYKLKNGVYYIVYAASEEDVKAAVNSL